MQQEKNVSGLIEDKSKQKREENEDNSPSWDIFKFNKTYQESILKVKDTRSFYVHGKYVRYSKISLGLLDNRTKFRWALVWLVTSKQFETFIISLIMINSIFLAIKDYTDVENLTPINKFVESAEPFFTYIFLCESVAKIIAFGWFLGNNTYLSDSWNWLDFIVVVTSLL